MLHVVSAINKNLASNELDLCTSFKGAGERNTSHRCHSFLILSFTKPTATSSVRCDILNLITALEQWPVPSFSLITHHKHLPYQDIKYSY